MASNPHLRSDSSESSTSSATSHQLILDHILTYPGTYELPLRTMYTLNCTPRAQPLPRSLRQSPLSSAGNSPTTPQFELQAEQATQQFTSSLMAQIAQMPSHPASLPPSFITAFVRKCFTLELSLVDFPQALTGLDYLKDLETRRRREVAAALERLDIRRETLGTAEDDLSIRYPGVLAWFRSLEEKERKIEALYTQLYIGLRRWILINELSLLPFNHYSCLAMLNTLYPPAVSTLPTSKLSPTILQKQRDGFFKYIKAVEKSGPAVLSNLQQQGKRPSDSNGWPAVRMILDQYLQVSNSVIAECASVLYIDDVAPMTDAHEKRKGRKVDSGVSLKPAESRKSSLSSIKDGNDDAVVLESSPAAAWKAPRPSRSGTTLEKIARELRHMSRSKTDVSEMIEPEPTVYETKEASRSLRKMRSFGSLSNLRKSNSSSPSLSSHNEIPAFDAEEMRRQRLIYEANAAKEQIRSTTP